MNNASLKRSIIFDEMGTAEDRVYSTKLKVIDWKKYGNHTHEMLRSHLGIDSCPRVDVKLSRFDNNGSREWHNLRVYVYETKHCHIEEIDVSFSSHAIQVSLGNSLSGWVDGDKQFNAKVFPNNETHVIELIEDVILDIQFFYAKLYNHRFVTKEEKQVFSAEKVDFIKQKDIKNYLGIIKDPEYVSFASFCRDESGKTDYEKYIKLWDKFDEYLNAKGMCLNRINSSCIYLILENHPKGKQISIKKLTRKVMNLETGSYLLVRTEKKPKKSINSRKIMNAFGMKKWKTGRIKIFSAKEYYCWEGAEPYVSVYLFEWEK